MMKPNLMMRGVIIMVLVQNAYRASTAHSCGRKLASVVSVDDRRLREARQAAPLSTLETAPQSSCSSSTSTT